MADGGCGLPWRDGRMKDGTIRPRHGGRTRRGQRAGLPLPACPQGNHGLRDARSAPGGRRDPLPRGEPPQKGRPQQEEGHDQGQPEGRPRGDTRSPTRGSPRSLVFPAPMRRSGGSGRRAALFAEIPWFPRSPRSLGHVRSLGHCRTVTRKRRYHRCDHSRARLKGLRRISNRASASPGASPSVSRCLYKRGSTLNFLRSRRIPISWTPTPPPRPASRPNW